MADKNFSHRVRARGRRGTICAISAVAVLGLTVAPTTSAGSVQVDTEAPGSPPGLDVSPGAINSLTLSWGRSTDNVGIAEYRVLRNGNVITSVPGSNFNVSLEDLPHGDSWLQVQAVDQAGNTSARTAPVLFVVDRRPPSAPAVIAATYDSTRNDVLLTFTASDVSIEATRYRVYENGRQVLDTGPSGPVDLAGNNVSVRLEANPGTRYFQVDETDASNNVSVRSAPTVLDVPAPDIRRPSAPQNVTASVVDASIQVSWDASNDDIGVGSYRLLVNGDRTGVAVAATSAVLDLIDVPTVWIQVVAIDASLKESVRSAPFRLDLPG